MITLDAKRAADELRFRLRMDGHEYETDMTEEGYKTQIGTRFVLLSDDKMTLVHQRAAGEIWSLHGRVDIDIPRAANWITGGANTRPNLGVVETDRMTLYLDAREHIKDRMDALHAEKMKIEEAIEALMYCGRVQYQKVTATSGRVYGVNYSDRVGETVTREGKTFIRCNAPPAMLDHLIKVTEKKTVSIVEYPSERKEAGQ